MLGSYHSPAAFFSSREKSGQQVQARGAARTRVAQQKSEHFAAAQGMAPRAQHSGELPASIATHGACGSWSRREETLTLAARLCFSLGPLNYRPRSTSLMKSVEPAEGKGWYFDVFTVEVS